MESPSSRVELAHVHAQSCNVPDHPKETHQVVTGNGINAKCDCGEYGIII